LDINLRQELLTRSTALSSAFEGGDGKRRFLRHASRQAQGSESIEGLTIPEAIPSEVEGQAGESKD